MSTGLPPDVRQFAERIGEGLPPELQEEWQKFLQDPESVDVLRALMGMLTLYKTQANKVLPGIGHLIANPQYFRSTAWLSSLHDYLDSLRGELDSLGGKDDLHAALDDAWAEYISEQSHGSAP